MMTATPPEMMTIATSAEIIGIKEWQHARLYERGFLPTPPKVGAYRVVRRDDLPAVREAARKAGYLPAEDAGAAM